MACLLKFRLRFLQESERERYALYLSHCYIGLPGQFLLGLFTRVGVT